MNLFNGECLKKVFYEKQNEEQLKYFLETFLGIKKEEKLEVHYLGVINEIYKSGFMICSDLIIIYGDNMIKINTHNLGDEFRINIIYGTKDDNEIGKILELRFCEDSHEENIIEEYFFGDLKDPDNEDMKDLYIMKIIDRSRLEELDNSSSMNRWLKFIGATSNYKRKQALENDQLLIELNMRLEN